MTHVPRQTDQDHIKGFISPIGSEGNRQILLLCFMGKVKGFVNFLAVKEY